MTAGPVARAALCLVVAVAASSCGEGPTDAVDVPASASALPCDPSDERTVALDIAGPGQPTPVEAVAPFAEGLTLVEQESEAGTTVLAIDTDGTVVRMFDVSEQQGGWWPDGYRECPAARP